MRISSKIYPLVIFSGLVISLFSWISALPGFGFGVFFQSEPPAVIIHFASSVLLLGFFLFYQANPERHLRGLVCLFSNPVVLLPLLIGGWSVFAAFFHSVPWRTIFGGYETGQGALQFSNIGFISAAFLILPDKAGFKGLFGRHSLVVLCVISAVGIVGLTLWPPILSGRPFAPYYFTDFTALLTFLAVVLVFSRLLQHDFTIGHLLPQGNAQDVHKLGAFGVLVFSLAVLVLVVWYSENRAAWVIFPLSVMAYALYSLMVHFRIMKINEKIIFSILSILPVMFFAALSFASNALPNSVAFASIKTRLQLSVLAVPAENIPDWIFGLGWGSFTDQLLAKLPLGKVDLMFSSNRTWDSLTRVDFHSHNFVAESLSSAGLVAVVLGVMWLASPVLTADKKLRPLAVALSVFVGCLSVLWFWLPATIPFIAIAFASLSPHACQLADGGDASAVSGATENGTEIPAKATSKTSILRITIGIWGLVLSLCFALAAFNSWNVSKLGYLFTPEMSLSKLDGVTQGVGCPEHFDDFGRGAAHLALRLRRIQSAMLHQVDKPEIFDPKLAPRFVALACSAEEYAKNEHPSLRLLLSLSQYRSDLAFASEGLFVQYPELVQLREDALVSWRDRIERFVAHAPNRTDQWAPYMLWLLSNGDERQIADIAARILENRPNDPVGLWFSGIVLLGEAQNMVMGKNRMQKALENGIDLVIPIDDQLKESLRGL